MPRPVGDLRRCISPRSGAGRGSPVGRATAAGSPRCQLVAIGQREQSRIRRRPARRPAAPGGSRRGGARASPGRCSRERRRALCSQASKRSASRRPTQVSARRSPAHPAGHPRPDRRHAGIAVVRCANRPVDARPRIRSTYASRSPAWACSTRSRSTRLAPRVASIGDAVHSYRSRRRARRSILAPGAEREEARRSPDGPSNQPSAAWAAVVDRTLLRHGPRRPTCARARSPRPPWLSPASSAEHLRPRLSRQVSTP